MKNKKLLVLVIFLLASVACKHTKDGESDEDSSVNTITPVTVTGIKKEALASYITLNASSSFLKKSVVKSPATGYIRELKVMPGDRVKPGQVLFVLQTKESSAYHDLNLKDSLLNFSGLIEVRAGNEGTAISLPHAKGDYVQEGDELSTLAEDNSLVFLLEVPYEFHSFIHLHEECDIQLPDGKKIRGKIESQLAAMDVSAQTQRFVIRPVAPEGIPENLVASISIVKTKKENASTLPREAVLTNETQSEFWVMKLESDSIAVKTIVHPGIQQPDRIEILDPAFTGTDRFVLTGGYGMADRARIVIAGNNP